ncbi:MAG: aminotransferase class I/II-fold pyridoxal phosphate-dependent enzyme [Hyphomicrobiales bacterium]|nr:aminotransferase class I/II-fold pyridoxal phosphate-dependent enzyme [Hyphomicrobiales bacterium]
MDKAVDLPRLDIDLSDPGGLPEPAIEAAVDLMRSGRLFRYGEYGGDGDHAALLEQEFAEALGSRYCAGVNSGGSAIFISLKAVGVQPGDEVLLNAFTLAPVPGAIDHAGASPVFVEIDKNYHIDLEDLTRKAESTGARVLLLSYMRGHVPDMDKVMKTADDLGLTVVEDCAHTMGAGWDGTLTGRFGAVGAFSAQTFKHVNSGEGGLLVTDDDDIAAKAVLYSGSYMLYAQHTARPSLEVFDRHRATIPNCSMRMSALAAALIRPQLPLLAERAARWNLLHAALVKRLRQIDGIRIPKRSKKEHYVASSLQFSLVGMDDPAIARFIEICEEAGVPIKWFGRQEPRGFTSSFADWGYVGGRQELPRTRDVLQGLCDMRIPLSLTTEHCDLIAETVARALDMSGRGD